MTVAPVELPARTRGRALSVLIHADTKVGKSTFGNTAPAPRLLLDAEAAYRFLPGKKVFWDPMNEEPPKWDGEWETCVVQCTAYGIFTRALDWLKSGAHPFRSVVIDSITEIQVKCKDDISPDGQMKIQLWGDLLTHMERSMRAFRDLTEHPTNPIESLVVTSMTEMRDGKWRPYVQGKLAVKAPYLFDVIGYMYVQEIHNAQDPTQPPTKMRRLLCAKNAQFEAGERVQGRLPEVVDSPTVPMMLNMVFGEEGVK